MGEQRAHPIFIIKVLLQRIRLRCVEHWLYETTPESLSLPDPAITELARRGSAFSLDTLPGGQQNGCIWQADPKGRGMRRGELCTASSHSQGHL